MIVLTLLNGWSDILYLEDQSYLHLTSTAVPLSCLFYPVFVVVQCLMSSDICRLLLLCVQMDSSLQGMLNDNSFDLTSKFADLIAASAVSNEVPSAAVDTVGSRACLS